MSGGITRRAGYGGKSLPETWGKIAGAGGLIRAGSGGPGGGGPGHGPGGPEARPRGGAAPARRAQLAQGTRPRPRLTRSSSSGPWNIERRPPEGIASPGRAGTVQAGGMIDAGRFWYRKLAGTVGPG